ncbi:MAG: aminotransferase class V-fold PLP-dependent enzyme [Xanthomonadaceae bacterium]|nr:aminotransferase class V-fold PLP-dependent enzyme [Rhodospirillaceae bacterium]NIA18228.1 aminotransferase class V-fold PLP-dependent enzyme [Xanthomonadaceae bacterium]
MKKFLKIKLYTPGPLEYYPFVKKAMKNTLHHRSKEFSRMMTRIRKNFSEILKSDPPIMLPSSGTGAINAVFQNFIDSNKKILLLSSGKFANRILKIMEFYKIEPTIVIANPGDVFNSDKIPNKKFDYIFMTYVETSTATRNNVEEIAAFLKQRNSDIKVIVDAVSAFGAYKIYPEKVGIDVLIGAPHKALGCPPGISFIWYSKKMKFLEPKDFYFNLQEEAKKQEKDLQFRFTPPVETVSALDASLDYVASNFLEFIMLHKKRAEIFRREIEKQGLELFSKSPANTLTSVKVKNADKIIERLKEEGFLVSKGSESYENTLRISHMGDVKINELKNIAKMIKKYETGK